jgi:hypothetical protein
MGSHLNYFGFRWNWLEQTGLLLQCFGLESLGLCVPALFHIEPVQIIKSLNENLRTFDCLLIKLC